MTGRRTRALLWGVLAITMTSGGAAQAAGDCAPFGRMPNYVAQDEPQQRNYDAAEFRIAKSQDEEETVKVAGRACRQTYNIKDGAEMASDLEIQQNYLSEVQKLGGQKLLGADRDLYAHVTQGAKEIWLYLYSQEDSIQVTVVEKQPFKPTLLPPSGSDHRLFGHMPNYVAEAPQKR